MNRIFAFLSMAALAWLGSFLFLNPKRRRYMLLILKQAPYIPFRYLT